MKSIQNRSHSRQSYSVNDDKRYIEFESASGLPGNEVSYRVTGHLAFERAFQSFSSDSVLRICDVGCFLGASTLRWFKTGQEMSTERHAIHTLGTDIHADNIHIASEKYLAEPNVSFQVMTAGGELPRIGDANYHLIFASFVLDTIAHFEEVRTLCHRMVEALMPQGEIYILRLHPAALRSQQVFTEYRIEPRETWIHGDPLDIHITQTTGQSVHIHDTFWEPTQIAKVFRSAGCEVTMLDVSLMGESTVIRHLHNALVSLNLPPHMPEWHTPLYQIIKATRVMS
jgi:2-polyprenyl-3-methyl-5-hydroxy-6-metoxy-1,4-benzoquinol methylase